MFDYILQIHIDDYYWYERPCKNYQEIKDTVKDVKLQQQKGRINPKRKLSFVVYERSAKASSYAEEMFSD